MTHPKAWKLILAGLGTAGVAVAIAVPLAMAGGGEPPQEQAASTDPTTLGVPAPGFAGRVDEMIVIDGPPEPLFNDGEQDSDAPTSLRVPAPGFAGKVDEMIVGEGPPEPLIGDGEAVYREGESIENGRILIPVEPGSLVHDVKGIAVGEPVPADVEIADEPHEAPKPRPVRDPQP